jgi:predicted lipoprotein with Yx(FWY)xxD motif
VFIHKPLPGGIPKLFPDFCSPRPSDPHEPCPKVAKEILTNANNNILTFEARENAIAVAIQQINRPLIQQFKVCALDGLLRSLTLAQEVSSNRQMAAGPAAAAANGAAKPTTATEKGTQLTQDQAIEQLSKFTWNLSLKQYTDLCNTDPSNRLACDPNFRDLQSQDYQALLSAKAQGITLKLPFIPAAPHGDYAVEDPFKITPSGLPKQLAALVAMKNGPAPGAADPASVAAQQQQAAADAATKKAAADAAAAAAAAAAAQKAAADAAASGDAAAAAAAQKAAADAAAQQAAAAAAQKAAADAAAAAKAAADAAAAALPRIKRVNGLLQTPTNRHTLYFQQGETPNSIICRGGCLGFWTPADPSWGNHASTGYTNCAGFVRTDGNQQLECDGKPLYTFVQDNNAGQAGGNAFNPEFINA